VHLLISFFSHEFVQDIENKNDQEIIIEETHARAHRGFDENLK